jgi:hypothetical protein
VRVSGQDASHRRHDVVAGALTDRDRRERGWVVGHWIGSCSFASRRWAAAQIIAEYLETDGDPDNCLCGIWQVAPMSAKLGAERRL